MDSRVKAVAALLAVGSFAVILYLALASNMPIYWFSVVLLGALMIICESLGENMSSGGRSTYGIIVIFAAIAALNTPSAMIVALFGAFHLGLARRREDAWNLAYTAVVYAMGVWAASALYHVLGGASRAFTLSSALKSLAPLLAAAAVFWVINTVFMAIALMWEKGVEPRDFVFSDALKLLPNQLIYALVGLGMGVIYAQNAFHIDPLTGEIVGSVAEYLRGMFAVLALTALLGVAWYFSGKNIELLEAYDHSMEVLVTHLEKREPYLDGHAVRVADYAALIGKSLRLPLYEIKRLRHAALLHDLGRPVVPREVLLLKGSLNEEEFEKVKAHPLEGASRLEEVEYLSDMADAVRHHHEYYDGGGYIDHIRGDTIPLGARIIAVADAYESMLHRRPWRDAKSPEQAAAELRQNSGRQFDPEIVEHFLTALAGEAEKVAVVEREEAEVRAEAPVDEKKRAPRPRRGRAKRREELLRERREARARIEREAMREYEEEIHELRGEEVEPSLDEEGPPLDTREPGSGEVPPEGGGETQ
jgi:HD-GYP domain-containing protein (c-di-GMP phosphodiesterase class II)